MLQADGADSGRLDRGVLKRSAKPEIGRPTHVMIGARPRRRRSRAARSLGQDPRTDAGVSRSRQDPADFRSPDRRTSTRPSLGIDQPGLQHAIFQVPVDLQRAIPPRGARRQDFDRQIRRAPDAIFDDRFPFRRNEDQIRLQHEGLASIEHDVHGRDTNTPQLETTNVPIEQRREPCDHRLMRVERCRWFVHHAEQQFHRPVGLGQLEIGSQPEASARSSCRPGSRRRCHRPLAWSQATSVLNSERSRERVFAGLSASVRQSILDVLLQLRVNLVSGLLGGADCPFRIGQPARLEVDDSQVAVRFASLRVGGEGRLVLPLGVGELT